jgi:hypothetical protein
MTGNTFVEYFPQPQAFAVTGGGAYCEGGDGVAIGLSGSQTNVLYQLKLNGENFGDALAGTGFCAVVRFAYSYRNLHYFRHKR